MSERLSDEALADFPFEVIVADDLDEILDGVMCAGIDADDDSHGARLRRHVTSLREQVRALTEAFRGEAPATFEAVADALGYCIDSPPGMAMAKHARQMETRARETEENVRALTADNAAKADAIQRALSLMRNEYPEDAMGRVQEMLTPVAAIGSGAAMLAEMEGLRTKTAVAMGVGGGAGSLFVHGDHASIKAAQGIVLERDTLRARVAELESERSTLSAHVVDLEMEHAEDQGVIRVWRGRVERAEAERDAAQQRVAEMERRIRTALVTMATGRLLMEDPLQAVHTAAGALGVDLSNTKNTPEEG